MLSYLGAYEGLPVEELQPVVMALFLFYQQNSIFQAIKRLLGSFP